MDQRDTNQDPTRMSSTSLPAAAGPRPQTNANSKARRLVSMCSTRDPYVIEKRPTFGQWVKVTWIDLLTILIVGLLVQVYFFASPFGDRVFPLDVQPDNGSSNPNPASVIPIDFTYPARRQMVSNWLIAVIAIAFPTLVISLMQFRTRSFWDWNNGLLGFLYALLTSAAFQATTKAFIGGLRPNFYDVCQPDITRGRDGGNRSGLNGIGFRGDMWTRDVCTNADAVRVRDAMQGFPSGHSTTMVAAMVYLSLYLNAKLKVFANYHTPLWKLIAITVPILGAVLLCGTLVIDHTHSWYDIAAGATIGAVVAFAAYRMVYPSIFDWRINHIPLNRNVPFDDVPRPGLVATARAGWRSPVKENDTGAARLLGNEGHQGENGVGPGTLNQNTL
ncbi:PAP2 superfamily-domain-containing protein [Xylaria palmicola]|nr:PAP2 superfamily-domain-containing protein [Xylaria palmicola]